jgi:SPP1 gp7 family putative phage head morphogenesis protein
VVEQHREAIRLGIAAGITGVSAAIGHAVSSRSVGMSPEAMRAAAINALGSSITTDPEKLSQALSGLYDSTQSAAESDLSAIKIPLTKMGVRLQEITAQTDQTANGIVNTTLRQIRTSIVNGVTQGQSAKDIGTAIDGIINDPSRADLIAVTETNAMYNAASLDSYQQAGVQTWNWVSYDGACDICESGEADNPHDFSDSPPPDASHPNCRCAVEGNV